MQKAVRFKETFQVRASPVPLNDRTRVLKQAETFAVFDRYGDMHPVGLGEQGLYHEGTRFLSFLRLEIGPTRPLLLSSTVKENNALLAVDLMNPDFSVDGVVVPRGALHIFRAKFLWQGTCYERLRITHYGTQPIRFPVTLHFDADYVDIFEVRGHRRPRRGIRLESTARDAEVVLRYRGLDGIERRTYLLFEPKPETVTGRWVRFSVELLPRASWVGFITIACETSERRASIVSFTEARKAAEASLEKARSEDCDIYTSNEQFNDWINRSLSDLHLLITETDHGWYPYAGVPWYATAFGRDGVITALEMLWVNPSVARGVLTYLAATQAEEDIPDQDAEPGKVLHETRRGEMANLGEIPFRQYYGSVDATLLFIILAHAYYLHTADQALVETLWPHIYRAVQWMDTFGDIDGDGFIEYRCRAARGLYHQGWRDSHDAVFHEDGTPAESPIALCEVQGYAYAAKRGAARLAWVLGKRDLADRWRQEADRLRSQFEDTFWDNALGFYVVALDRTKRPCRVRASNAGHCLFTGIADPERARRVADTLLSKVFFTGWGIRTLASTEVRYNPMSYHNGSVWPHDNAIIARGLARYGFKDHVLKVMTGLFDATLFLELHRMPELFCGFERRPGEGPTLYPVACNPQAWAAAAVFMLLEACMGLTVNAPARQVRFAYPILPPFLQEVRIQRLRVGDGEVDILLRRHEQDVTVRVLRREGPVEIVAIK